MLELQMPSGNQPIETALCQASFNLISTTPTPMYSQYKVYCIVAIDIHLYARYYFNYTSL